MESSLKRGSRECTEGKEGKKTADGKAPVTGLCISTKTLKDFYKRAFYSGGGCGT